MHGPGRVPKFNLRRLGEGQRAHFGAGRERTGWFYRFGLIKYELLLSFLIQSVWKKKTQQNKHSINFTSGASKS